MAYGWMILGGGKKLGHRLSSSLLVPEPPASPAVTREMLSRFISAQSTCQTNTRKRCTVEDCESTARHKQKHGEREREGGAAEITQETEVFRQKTEQRDKKEGEMWLCSFE